MRTPPMLTLHFRAGAKVPGTRLRSTALQFGVNAELPSDDLWSSHFVKPYPLPLVRFVTPSNTLKSTA